MQDKPLSKFVINHLDLASSQIGEEASARLHAARVKAMGRMREPVHVLGLVTISGHLLDPAHLVRQPLFWLPVLAIAIALAMFQFNASDDLYDQTGAIDAKILSAELPPEALLDKDFAEWVKESSLQQ